MDWKPIEEAPMGQRVLVRDSSGCVRISQRYIPEDHTTVGTFYGKPQWSGDRNDWEPVEWQELPE